MTGFTERHQEQLFDAYPKEIVEQIVDQDNWQYAPVPGAPGETIPYVHVKPLDPAPNAQKLLYIPGFGEGIINKAPTAAESATRGHEFVLTGQNRTALAKGAMATDAQAANYLSVLEHVGWKDASPTVLAKSFGGLVFNAMSRISQQRDGQSPFKDSTVFLLDSAGLIENESKLRLGRGWVGMMASEMKKKTQDFPDKDGSTGKASLATLATNKARTLHEVGDMLDDLIDPELAAQVGQLVVVQYAESGIFPSDRTASHVGKLLAHGAIVLTPISLQDYEGGVRGGRGAVHDDEQLNPTRVAGSIDHYLKHSA